MDTTFMISENSNISDLHRLLLNFSDKINLKKNGKYVALSNLNYTWKNIKQSYKSNKFKVLAPTWNEEYELPDASCSVSSVQDHFEHIFKK